MLYQNPSGKFKIHISNDSWAFCRRLGFSLYRTIDLGSSDEEVRCDPNNQNKIDLISLDENNCEIDPHKNNENSNESDSSEKHENSPEIDPHENNGNNHEIDKHEKEIMYINKNKNKVKY